MQAAHIQGEIDKKRNIIPRRILICASMISFGTLIMFTPNIITGMLKIIIIKLPTAKFFLFNRFIDPEIAVMQVIIGDPIKKLNKIFFKLTISMPNKIPAIGIIIKKGICKKKPKNNYF
jgi:hypothetical protein